VELAGTPGSLGGDGPGGWRLWQCVGSPAVLELHMESVDVRNDEAIHRSIMTGSPLRWVVPLKVNLDAVASECGVTRTSQVVNEGGAEAQPPEEVQGPLDVAGHENWVNGLEAGVHWVFHE